MGAAAGKEIQESNKERMEEDEKQRAGMAVAYRIADLLPGRS